MISSSQLNSPADIDAIRQRLIQRANELDGIDFDEHLQIPWIRSSMRVWKDEGRLVGFAYVDGYDNLWFDLLHHGKISTLADEIIEWGCHVVSQRNLRSNTVENLDCSCHSDQTWRIELLAAHGFIRQTECSIKYSRSISAPPIVYAFPTGFDFRCVNDQDCLEDLVTLHQAAFGTSHMTIEERRAMMHSPQYIRELNLLVVTPNGQMVAFCLAGFKDRKRGIAYTDPIGTHPHYRRLGLARALVSNALILLSTRGARTVEFATSSENLGMHGLVHALGFLPVSEKLWFSKAVSRKEEQ